ncbi:transposase, partial [Candidatus Roizmanbacteria bacterium]|nr:transposase [Candidatus Roizmanbacteria bacterium]
MEFPHKQRRNVRLPGYNYSTNGSYFITNNTDYSKPYINDIIKTIAKEELFDLEKRYTGMQIYYFSLMPTHIHVIISLNDCKVPIPEIWRVYKSKSTVMAKKNGFIGKRLWQRNYYEHVVRNVKALERIVRYIRNNP